MARCPRTVFLSLLCAASCARALAQPAGLPDGPPAQVEGESDVAQTKPADFIYVATTRPDRIGRVMVPVFVNDVGPFAFLIDTGASSSVLSPRVAARLKLTAHPTRTALLRGITGSEVVPTVLVDKISAGGITLTARHLPVVEPRVFADADGIFGADVFGHGCLKVEFKVARVSIHEGHCPRRSGGLWEEVPAQLRFGGLPVVTARVGNVRVAGIIDSGAERSLGNPALLAALGLEAAARDPAARIQVYAATSQLVFGSVVESPTLRVGGIQIDRLVAIFGPFDVFRLWGVENEPALVIGMDILGSTDGLMIDFERQRVRLLPRIPDGVVIERRGNGSRVR